MRISKVTTKTGDDGTTGLVGGARVSKASARVEAYGDVDELNSLLGLARAKGVGADLDALVARLQHDLFTLGADLAAPEAVASPRVEERHVLSLEEATARLSEETGPLAEFILPGGTEAAAVLQVARSVARRAERRSVALARDEAVNRLAIVFLNRLSDLLFVAARAVNKRQGGGEAQASFGQRGKT